MPTSAAARAAELSDLLGLRAHPEGGRFVEIFRSDATVQTTRGERRGLTTIYFLLQEGERSRWHRVASDEAWHWIEGAPLELLLWTPGTDALSRHLLGPCDADGRRPVAVAPADAWQAARSTGDYTLVACDVGPGFVFEDFTLAETPEDRAALAALGHEASSYI